MNKKKHVKVNKKHKVDKRELFRKKEDIQNLMSHLEEEYRKAEISDKNYSELKSNYVGQIASIDSRLGIETEVPEESGQPEAPPPAGKDPFMQFIDDTGTQEKSEPEVPVEEVRNQEPETQEAPEEPALEPEEAAEEEEAGQEPEEAAEKTEKPKEKKGLFSRFLGKKKAEEVAPDQAASDEGLGQAPPTKGSAGGAGEEPDLEGLDPSDPKAIEKLAAQAMGQAGAVEAVPEQPEEDSDSGDGGTQQDVEIEKLKVMIDTLRDSNKNTQESMANLAESVGEVRSMVFQTEGSQKEEIAKMERIEDELGDVKPKRIQEKFQDIMNKLGQADIIHEKFQRKEEDLGEKVNKIFELLKAVGGIENLVNVNKEIQKKMDDIKEALRYTERLSLKTERIFIDLNKQMQDLIIYKTKQDNLEEGAKEVTKTLDTINVKIEGLPTLKDLDPLRGDIMNLQNQIDEFNKALPMLETKLPEAIMTLREERNNILMFLDSLEEHYGSKTLNRAEYEDAKRKNEKKLAEIDSKLKDEWSKVQRIISGGGAPEEAARTEGETELPPAEEPTSIGAPTETATVQEKKTELTPDKDAEEKKPAEPEPRYVCEICGEKFQTGRAKGGHMSKHKREQEKKALEEKPKETAPVEAGVQDPEIKENKEEERKKDDDMISLEEKIKRVAETGSPSVKAGKHEEEVEEDTATIIRKIKEKMQ